MAKLYAVSNVKARLDAGIDALKQMVANRAGIAVEKMLSFRIVKKSLDARKKPNLFFVYQIEFTTVEPLPVLSGGIVERQRSVLEIAKPPGLERGGSASGGTVIVVGSGPAGLFAALALGEAGLRTVLLERGKPVETRMKDIGQLRSHGILDPESNVCFGEGGAGTYTDGKLYTRIKDPLVSWVMRCLVDLGAPPEILIDAHPHLGTDKLVRLIKRMRERLMEKDVDIRFQAKMERLLIHKGKVRGCVLTSGEELRASRVVMAVGHSARDTLGRLHRDGVRLEAKPFAVGIRAEHPQTLINRAQYGCERHSVLGAASYSLTHQIPVLGSGLRGVYSFCMCPGGFVVPSPTEPFHMVVNGMSNANRSTAFANSGVVVQVSPEDLVRAGFEESPLVGAQFQKALEAACFESTRQPYAAPAMRITDFVAKRPSGTLANSLFRPAVEPADLWELLPNWIAEPLRTGLLAFDSKLKGYVTSEANLLAVETRTSSPIRITRGENMESVSVAGLYPVGEGAGYAGGIVSAAVDGLRAARAILGEP